VNWIAGQFTQAATELVESWVGSGGGERLGMERGKENTTPDGKDGRVRPPLEADRLLQEEEEKEKKLEDWRVVEEVVLEQEEEDSAELSPRVKESWVLKRDNPWNTPDKEWLRAQLEAPGKEQIAGRCAMEGHWQVWEETCGGAEHTKKGMRPYWKDAESPERLRKLTCTTAPSTRRRRRPSWRC
jgi:hypothetical protein